MQVESRKSFAYGFVLNEAELRRLVDLILDQFKKLQPSIQPILNFQMKFKNGVIADTNSLEEVLGQENLGPSQILKLTATFKIEETNVDFEFINVDEETDSAYNSIKFLVRANSRDWVFITSTLLEERITKVKRFAPNQLFKKSSFIRLLALLIIPLMMIPVILLTSRIDSTKNKKIGSSLEQAYKDSSITNPIEALIFVEKSKENNKVNTLSISEFLLYVITPLFVLLIISFFFLKYYLVYNFCWGDYIEYFNRKESIRKFVSVVVLLGIIVSFVGGLLSNKL